MSQVILFGNNPSIFNELKSTLEKELAVDISELNSLDQILSIIPILPELDAIFVNITKDNLNFVIQLEEYLKKTKHKAYLFLIGNYQTKREQSYIYPVLENINKVVSDFKKINAKNFLSIQNAEENLPSYVGIPIDFILQNKTLKIPVDIYLRIKSGDDFQYVKRLNANDSFDDKEFDNFLKHKVSHFYTPKSEYKTFLEFAIKITTLNVPKESKQEIILQQNVNYHISRDALAMIGIGEETIYIVHQNIEQMESMIANESALALFIKTLKQNYLSYAYSQAYLMSIILTKVVSCFDWDSQNIRKRICYIAYLHDIALSSDHLTKIHSEEERLLLPPHEAEEVNNHAFNSAQAVDKITSIPMGISQIIKEHHGQKTGVGFNESQPPTIQPLSMIFLVVEDFVHSFLSHKNPTKEDLQKIVENLIAKYQKGNYRKAAEYLKEILPK